jgi:hypothetical protein
MTHALKVASSRIEDGREICNTCIRPVETPYRYRTPSGETRGCIASCHDRHVRRNTKPDWIKARYVLPKWITEARNKVVNFERVTV